MTSVSDEEAAAHDVEHGIAHISIDLQAGCDGDAEDLGLRYPDDSVVFTDAQGLLDHIKETCKGDKYEFIRDWCLLENVELTISVSFEKDGRHGNHSSVEWA